LATHDEEDAVVLGIAGTWPDHSIQVAPLHRSIWYRSASCTSAFKASALRL